METLNILVVRLGSMGDILHTLPAAASLKHSFPHSRLSWAVDPKWLPLLEDNPFLDATIPLVRRGIGDFFRARRKLRETRHQVAVDFQGLIQSAVAASLARPDRIYGFHQSEVRERFAALFYSTGVQTRSKHVVDKNLELAAAAGAANVLQVFPVPAGRPEGELPREPFVLASPLAGWVSKQWPLENYSDLGQRLRTELGLRLVLNGAPGSEAILASVKNAALHISGLAGLIDATRKATAVVGLDSGPMHLAAALSKPGVALFGPTDPERNGPYCDTMTILRSPRARTSYKRRTEIDPSMHDITPEAVLEALKLRLSRSSRSAGNSA
ncbi:MAG: glycosyltransferase family 9 protein [Bryobacteraceae bacterium]